MVNYIALTKVKRRIGLKILICDSNEIVTNQIENIVYKLQGSVQKFMVMILTFGYWYLLQFFSNYIIIFIISITFVNCFYLPLR